MYKQLQKLESKIRRNHSVKWSKEPISERQPSLPIVNYDSSKSSESTNALVTNQQPSQNAGNLRLCQSCYGALDPSGDNLDFQVSREKVTRSKSIRGLQGPKFPSKRRTTVPNPEVQQFNSKSFSQQKASNAVQQPKYLLTSVAVQVHPYTDDPNVAWEMLRPKTTVKLVKQMKIDTPMRKDAVRFVCISDTHSRLLNPSALPPGDVLIVAGDFTSCGSPDEIKAFSKFLSQTYFAYKIVIAGNHEMTFDPTFRSSKFEKKLSPKAAAFRKQLLEAMSKNKLSETKSLLKNCIYLEDSLVEIFGITIYGAPWLPVFDNWAFNLPRGQALLDKWNKVPNGIDILITHSPPLGHGDLLKNGVRVGCAELLNSVCKRIRPKYHVFGHVHEGYGCTTDGYTKFINASVCDAKLQPTNQPVLFDIRNQT